MGVGCWLGLHTSNVCGGNPETDFAVAAQEYRAQNWPTAQARFGQFVQQYRADPHLPDALFYQAESAAQAGRWQDAVPLYAQFRQAYGQHEQAATAQFRLAEAEYLAGNDARARPALDEFVKSYSQHVLSSYALPYLGDIAWKADQFEAAKYYYDRALREFPDGFLAAKCLCQLGMLDFRDGNWQAASEKLLRFTEVYPQDPQHRQASYWLGRTEIELGDFATASDRLTNLARQAVASNPQDPGVVAEEASIAYFAGRANRLAGRLDEATEFYRRVQQQWPGGRHAEDAAYDELLMLLARDGDLRKPADQFRLNYPKSPRIPDVERLLVQQMLDRKQFVEAERIIAPRVQRLGPSGVQQEDVYLLAVAQLGQNAYQKALNTFDLHPAAWSDELEANVWIARASALSELKQYPAAVTVLQDFLAKYSQLPAAGKVRELLGVAMARMGNPNGALNVVRSADPAGGNLGRGANGVLSAELEIAKIAFDQGQYEKALEAYQNVLQDPQRSANDKYQALSGLGLTQIKLGAWQQAVSAFEDLVRSDPAPGRSFLIVAHQGLGKAYDELQQVDQAVQNYEALLKLDPREAGAASARLQVARWHESRKQKLSQDPSQKEAAQKEYKLAVAQLSQLEKDFATSPEYPAALYLWAWLEKDQQNHPEAIKKFGRLAKDFPESEYWEDAIYRVADYSANAKKYNEAYALLYRLIQDGDDAEIVPYARYLQGQVLAGLKKWEEIPDVLSPLVESSTAHSLQLAAKFWIAESHYRLDQFELARQELHDLADLTKGNSATWVPMIPLRLAQIKAMPTVPPDQKDPQDWEDALELADSIRPEFPNFPQQFEVDYVRGRCLMGLARIEEARTAFQQAKNAPEAVGTETQAMAHWMIGESYYQQQQYVQALVEYESAIKTYRSYPLWQAHASLGAGLASEKLGRKPEAVDYYQRLLKDFPDSDDSLIAQAEDRLRKIGVDPNGLRGSRQANRVPSMR